jgi:hypothetical protein
VAREQGVVSLAGLGEQRTTAVAKVMSAATDHSQDTATPALALATTFPFCGRPCRSPVEGHACQAVYEELAEFVRFQSTVLFGGVALSRDLVLASPVRSVKGGRASRLAQI